MTEIASAGGSSSSPITPIYTSAHCSRKVLLETLRECNTALALIELELIALANKSGLTIGAEVLHSLLDLFKELAELLKARLSLLLLDLS